MKVFVPAEAGTDPDEIRVFNDVGRPLVVQDVVGLFCHEDRFVDKDPPQFSIHPEEELLDKILFNIDVLVKKLAQVFLVDISPGAHEREFKKADHGGRKDKLADPVVIGVDQQAFFAEMIQQLFRLRLRRAPQPGCLFQGKRTDGELCHPFCLFFGKKHAQYFCECFRRSRALGKPVDPVFQIPVSVS